MTETHAEITSIQCLNCSASLTGSFCHECGQSTGVQRYSFRTIGNEIYEQFRKVDVITTFKTFRELATRPGDFIRSYLSGQRVDYLAPIKFFFYSFVVQIAVGGWVFWLTNDRSFESLTHIEFRVEIISFISTAFWGILWAVFYRKSGLNIVECMVAALFFAAETNFFGIIIQIITYPIARNGPLSKEMLGLLELLLPILYSFYFVRQLFQEHLALLFIKQLTLTFLYALLVVAIYMIIFAFERIV
jgi:hypothetical protein